MREVLLDKTWLEFKKALSIVEYGRLFIDKQSKKHKVYDVVIVLFSSGGIIGTLVSHYFPIVATGLIAVISLIKETSSLLFIKNEDVTKLSTLLIEYDKYACKVQDLFDSLNADKIKEDKAQQKYNKLYEDYSEKRIEISKLFGKIDKKLERQANAKVDNNLVQTYNIKL